MITHSVCVTVHFRRRAIQVVHTCTRSQMQSGWSRRVWACILSPRFSPHRFQVWVNSHGFVKHSTGCAKVTRFHPLVLILSCLPPAPLKTKQCCQNTKIKALKRLVISWLDWWRTSVARLLHGSKHWSLLLCERTQTSHSIPQVNAEPQILRALLPPSRRAKGKAVQALGEICFICP